MEKFELKAISDEVGKYCHLQKEGSYIILSLWNNGEGFDIDLNGKLFPFTFGEFKAVKKLLKELLK